MNKANASDHNLRTYTALAQLGLSGLVTMEQICEAMPNNSVFYLASNPEILSDGPSGYAAIVVQKQYANYVLCNAVDSAGKHWQSSYRSLATPKFRGWVPIATAAKPQEYDLPLAAGVTGAARYSKTQEGLLIIPIEIKKADGTAFGSEFVATSPEGFRPRRTYFAAGVGCTVSGGQLLGPVQIRFSTDGKLHVLVESGTSPTLIRGEVICLAS